MFYLEEKDEEQTTINDLILKIKKIFVASDDNNEP